MAFERDNLDSSTTILAYLTPKGREYFLTGDPKGRISSFSLQDANFNYLLDEAYPEGNRPSVTGTDEGLTFRDVKELRNRICVTTGGDDELKSFTTRDVRFEIDCDGTTRKNIEATIDLGSFVNFLLNEHDNSAMNFSLPSYFNIVENTKVVEEEVDSLGDIKNTKVHRVPTTFEFETRCDFENYQKLSALHVFNSGDGKQTVLSQAPFSAPLNLVFSNMTLPDDTVIAGSGNIGFNFFNDYGYVIDDVFYRSNQVEVNGALSAEFTEASEIKPAVSFDGSNYKVERVTDYSSEKNAGANLFKLFSKNLITAKDLGLREFMETYGTDFSGTVKVFDINLRTNITAFEGSGIGLTQRTVSLRFSMDMDENNWNTSPTESDIITIN